MFPGIVAVSPCSPRTGFLPLALTTMLFLTFLWYDFFFLKKNLLVFLSDLLLQDFDISSLLYYCNNKNLGSFYEFRDSYKVLSDNSSEIPFLISGNFRKSSQVFKNMYFKHPFSSDSRSYGEFLSVLMVLFSETPTLALTLPSFTHFNSNGVSFLSFPSYSFIFLLLQFP